MGWEGMCRPMGVGFLRVSILNKGIIIFAQLLGRWVPGLIQPRPQGS